MNPKVKELPNKKCLTNFEAKRIVYQTVDKSTYHKLKKVSTKAGEDLYTTTKINHLLNIVDRILHSQWKEDTVKLDTIYLQLPMKNGFYNYATLLSAVA